MKTKEPPNEYRGLRRKRGFGSNLIHAVKPEAPNTALCGREVRIGYRSTAGIMTKATDLDFISKPCEKCKEYRESRVQRALATVGHYSLLTEDQ